MNEWIDRSIDQSINQSINQSLFLFPLSVKYMLNYASFQASESGHLVGVTQHVVEDRFFI